MWDSIRGTLETLMTKEAGLPVWLTFFLVLKNQACSLRELSSYIFQKNHIME